MFKFGKSSSSPSAGQFSTKEIQRIQRRFLKLSADRQRAPVAAIQNIPELANNPFAVKILSLFDSDRDGFITMDEFVYALQSFRNLQHPEDKLKLVFKLYDLDNDGFVGEAELIATMRQVQQHLSDQQLEQIAKSTILEYDQDGDGKLSIWEFRQLVGMGPP
mmetsp:Transcript_30140/g.85088  ORF Transcript_30140/g.85088 Transcript_30140/m.85088 type:complete len:162 (+) Transcript_30140:417-902(+)|eukprot:CAMPEP_0117681010 /NCGR_PEP_ID=MMETSP0804-20121206/18710_1 /TAXON_ID=1074897 /ORGANISM="Tetraselmis astigmatica, Strain CCMP880" /LENGTH=161 /DNA_ID=CAMNT_0005490651 /DNA_START=388 /DNA_END=873 /DNA_ORIENTATION=+